MRAAYVRRTIKPGQGITDFGYYSEDPLPSTIEEAEERVENDEAFLVEVFSAGSSQVIRLTSDDRRVVAETRGKLERRGHGLDESLYVTGEDPQMVKEYGDRNQALEMFAEYALEHGSGRGLEMDFSWDDVLEEENMTRR
jgi:hypothetical protein